ncbi:hypothetical protein BDD12DRAFT_818365 [Trichophaea hybrida]|nr:hypothetical protein BDD12DRAFT_818365 [Trichophaea hybrida]
MAWGGGSSKSRRYRLVNRIRRFASSPTLTKAEQTPALDDKQSVSCVTLSSGGEENFLNSSSSLELFVDCDDGSEVGKKKQEAKWQSLPDEIKMRILSWIKPTELVKCSSVSKEFQRLCYDGQLWKTLDASEFYNRIPVEQLSQLIVSAGSFVRHLNLRGCVHLQTDWRIEAVANACRNLISASLEGCKFENPIIHFIIMRNPRLVHVNLSGLSAVTNSTCRKLAESCCQIESLNVSFCTNTDGRGLRRVVEDCKNLRELKACELHMNDPGLMQALFKTNKVERLYLGDAVGVTDEFIRLLVEGVDPDIDPFTNRSTAPPRKLVHLDLGKCTQLTDEALRHLSNNVPFLDRLELGGIVSLTDAGLAELLPTLPNLTHLDVEECLELTNATLINIARGPAAKNLVHLQVSYCENMGDVGMMELLRKCERLRNLEMDNTRVSDLTLAEAANVVRQRPVHRPITSRAASHVALRMVVFDCSNITWTGIREILSRNTEYMRENSGIPGLVLLKCFYEYQKTVDEHTKLVLRREINRADYLEESWAQFMMASEEASANGRRGRRARNMNGLDDDAGGIRRRGRGGLCAIM